MASLPLSAAPGPEGRTGKVTDTCCEGAGRRGREERECVRERGKVRGREYEEGLRERWGRGIVRDGGSEGLRESVFEEGAVLTD
jgi:hypothetical protein